MMEVGSWQHWALLLFPPQTINEEQGRDRHTLQCLEETDSIYVFLYETQRTNSKKKKSTAIKRTHPETPAQLIQPWLLEELECFTS